MAVMSKHLCFPLAVTLLWIGLSFPKMITVWTGCGQALSLEIGEWTGQNLTLARLHGVQ